VPDTVGLELHGQTSLCGIATRAKTCKDHRFQDLYRKLDVDLLLQCWGELNKDSASGVDKVTAADYGQELMGNIQDLVQRLKAKRYRTKLVRRVYIPKDNGKERPLGIPALEDKLVQMACAKILGAIYERDFLPVSYGYRPKRGAKDAVLDLGFNLQYGRFGYVVEADIKGFLDRCSYYPPADFGSSKRSGIASGSFILSPLRLPCETWTASSSPRLTRCNTVWRDTPRMRMASTIGT